MEARKVILFRVYIAFFLLCLFGMTIIFRIGKVQFVEGERWKEKADSMTLDYITIEAKRGNIYSSDNKPLAFSTPIYDLHMDTRAGAVTDEIFASKVDSLALGLSQIFNDRSQQEYRSELIAARAANERYHLIRRNVGYLELQEIKKLPIFNLGRYRGGLLTEERNRRELPYRELAKRTIGTLREVKGVGLEKSFNDELQGISGRRLMQKISGNTWKPVTDNDEIESKDGNDLITTLDVNIQDVAENSLEKCLRYHNADHGCAVLMEVETGEIKAIANLSRMTDGSYREVFNYAIAEKSVPGSTFKLASMLAVIDDGYADTSDLVAVGKGTATYFGHDVVDAHAPKAPKLTVKEVFEQSSNVGTTRLITQYYSGQPENFIRKLYSFGLGTSLKLQLEGERDPYIKHYKDSSWSGISLPWISYGYETELTPMQILAFYNGVANNGRVVRPLLVKEIRHNGQLIRSINTEIIHDSIASQVALAKVRRMMEGVVEHGTASELNKSPYKIAGKTGTAQLGIRKQADGTSVMAYQASFVGYFPADHPKYSCIVVVNAPSNDVYYGGAVAAPVFKDIADKVYSTRLDLQMNPLLKDTAVTNPLPLAKAGSRGDMVKVMSTLAIPYAFSDESPWVSTVADKYAVTLKGRTTTNGLMPNVVGMGLRDALYILENQGVQVVAMGRGKVVRQSVTGGSAFTKGTKIELTLNQ